LHCIRCGKSVVPGAAFCAFCGSAVETRRRVPSNRSTPVPERSELEGPCSVIYAGEGEMDVRSVGRLVAEAVQRPLPDVTRRLRTSKGFLATGLPAEAARSLAEKAEAELKAPILVVPDDQCVPLPLAMRMRRASLDADGLRCDAYSWNLTERVEATWNAVFLVSCARLQVEEVVPGNDASPTRTDIFMRRSAPLVTRTHHEFLLDIVLYDADNGGEGWRRLRLDQNTCAFSLTEMTADPDQRVGPLYRSAVNIERIADDVPMNAGVSLLANGATGEAWESLTFLTKNDFDMYTHWLLQLVRFGVPVPR